jgi:calcium binding protein
MAKPKKNPVREERIDNDVVVDAYGSEERAMGWYYYLENKIRFPFRAKCITAKVVSPLRKGEIVDVQRLAPEEACSGDMLVLIRWHGRNVAVPLSQLIAMDNAESSDEAISDWHYWVAQGYRF